MGKDIRSHTKLELDCHLMIVNPEKYIGNFADSGADIITVHYETCKENLKEVLKQIKSYNIKCGAVLNPDTSPEKLQDVIEMCDMVLLMSVYPGFGGQKFIESVLSKIEIIRDMIFRTGKNIDLQIDGGVTLENIKKITDAGANVIVAGSTVFNSDNPKSVINALKNNK
jgi:ribulose-phosphate 3-epimerase